MSEIKRLNGGLVVNARIMPPKSGNVYRTVDLVGRTPRAVTAELKARTRRGEVVSAGPMQLFTGGPNVGCYGIRIVSMPPRPPVLWPRRLVAGGILLAGLGIVLAAGAWFLAALSTVSLGAVCVALILGLGAIVLATRKSGSVTVISNINVRR